jgi:hypothetical protein
MNDSLFIENWAKLDRFTQKALKDYSRNPSDSNQSYMVGYLGALADRGLVPEISYWLAIVGQLQASKAIVEAIRYSALD